MELYQVCQIKNDTCLQGKYAIQIGQCTLTELHAVLTFLFLQ